MTLLALKMLLGDRTKYLGLLFEISSTTFLVTFAVFCFGGVMTRSFPLIAENPRADVWVMDSAVVAVDRPINLPTSVLGQVRSVEGVGSAVPLALEQTQTVPEQAGFDDRMMRSPPGDLPIFVGQQMDVFIDTAKPRGFARPARPPRPSRGDRRSTP